MRTVNELMNLEGRKALITGATGCIGSVISDTLGELGCELILVDRPGSDFEKLKTRLKKSWNSTVFQRECDLESEKQPGDLLEWLRNRFEKIDILINNAAFVGESSLGGWVTAFEEQSVNTWRRALEVNLTAVFELVQGCSPLMHTGHGSVINISSIYGMLGPDFTLYDNTAMGNPAAYAASKGGLLQLTRWLSTALAPEIRVNAISPGGVFRNQPEEFVRRYEKRTPLARMATEEDFKGAIAYLASDLSSYCTGHNLVVDGGWAIW
ncbi:gluconate 5-dehydrogenase [Desulfomarina profundi]|uniref:Gluconate 5-dehydrogenase n=1 Tax=Desulfomarina profundi TaxID=2772557 RepID=A0A8D5JNY5_9BACT|nr:SDR family oxidoreductase [Desulfomarina profundi]BCL60665.1 gluconate 5-dehydrogenase [Desulfomarina profundi]